MRMQETVSALLSIFNLAKSQVLSHHDDNIFKCLNMSVENNVLTVIGTSTSSEYQGTYALENAKQAKPGQVSVNADHFMAFFTTLNPDLDVEITKLKASLKVVQGDVKCNIPLVDGEYPSLTCDTKKPTSIKLSRASFIYALDTVAYAAAKNDTRYFLNGVNMNLANSKLEFTATDANRLANLSLDSDCDGKFDTIVSRDCVKSLVVFLLNSEDSEVEMKVTSNTVSVLDSDSEFKMRVIDGKYPDWKAKIGSDEQASIELRVSDAKSLVERAKSIALSNYNQSRKARANRMTIALSDDRLYATIKPKNDDGIVVGLDDSVEGKTDGLDISATINPVFLSEALRSLPKDANTVSIILSSSNRIWVKPQGADEQRHLVLGMNA